MSFKYHGNYCGPGYTGGEFTSVGNYAKAPVDSLDAKCRAHDHGYEFGNSHAADHALLKNTSYGFNKEGLLKLGFTLKDKLYNNFFVPLPSENMQKRKHPAQDEHIQQSRPSKRQKGPDSKAVVMIKEKVLDYNNGLRDGFNKAKQRGSDFGSSTIAKGSGNSRQRSKRHYVEEDEYLAEVLGSTSTTVPTVTSYPVNPGQVLTFPWLSKEAAQWEKWGVDSIEFYYKPEVSEYNTQGSQGKVLLSCNYDAADSPPTTKQQIEDTVPHADHLPCKIIRLKLDPHMLIDGSLGKYVRTGNLPGQADIRLYDGGNLFVSTIGCSSTATCGELHVKYRVWFAIPILPSSALAAPANNSVSMFCSSSAESYSTVNTVQVLALATALTNGLGLVNTAGSIVLPAGNYLLDATAMFISSAIDQIITAEVALYNVTTGHYLTPGLTLGTDNESGCSTIAQYTSISAWPNYISVNAPTTLNLVVRESFSGGTQTCIGQLRITAI